MKSVNRIATIVISSLIFLSYTATALNSIDVDVKDKKLFDISKPFAIIYVDDDGGQDYTKIQDAIDNATEGDVIFVFNGTYYENLDINKRITLIGEKKNSTIIDGNKGKYVIYVTEDNVTFTGFTVQNSLFNGADIEASNCIIKNNIFRDNGYLGISVKNSSKALFSDNTIIHNKRGFCLCLNDKNTEICHNTIEHNEYCGIYLYESSNNNLYRNHIADNLCGIIVSRSNNNTIHHNHISCKLCNINLYRSPDNTITKNNIFRILVCAFFTSCKNKWDCNYWSMPRILPKPIFGRAGERGIAIGIEFDRSPALRPYEI